MGRTLNSVGDVGGALYVGVPAQRQDAAARTPDVAEEQLQDRRGADDLGAAGMLREASRVAERRCAIAARVAADELADLHDVFGAASADLGHDLWRVVAELLLDELEHAVGVLQRRVLLGLPVAAVGVHLVLVVPGRPRLGIRFGLRVPAVEEAGHVIEVEARVDEGGRVGVVDHVLLEPVVMLEDVVDETADERDVGTGAGVDVVVAYGRRAREARGPRGW